jgi:hypothetical protein
MTALVSARRAMLIRDAYSAVLAGAARMIASAGTPATCRPGAATRGRAPRCGNC